MKNETTGGSQFRVGGKTHYQRNRSAYIKRVHARRRVLVTQIQGYKTQRVCEDCEWPGKICPEAMEFDHIRGKKFMDVGKMAYLGYSWERILAEIAKCDLVCARCHRIRTVARQAP